VIEKHDPVQMRTLLQRLHLEIVLRSRRLDISTRKPLSLLVTAGATSSWRTMWPEIWKWIQFGEVEADDGPQTVDGGGTAQSSD
jgi:hypothetical protein